MSEQTSSQSANHRSDGDLHAEMGRILTCSYGRGKLGISKRAQTRARQHPKRDELTNRFETTRGDQIEQPVSKNNRRKRDENEDQIEAESSCIAETRPSSTGTCREIPETSRKHLLERSVRRISPVRKPQQQTPKMADRIAANQRRKREPRTQSKRNRRPYGTINQP
jgi:hypothetical protein